MTPDEPTICAVLPSAAAVLGIPGSPDPLGLRAELGGARQVVVVLVDGLGLHLLPRLTQVAPFLSGVLEGRTGSLRTLRSTFPSTTPTSLASLTTGARPGEHGILGFTTNVPGTRDLLTHVLWGDDPTPETWQPVPTWFERLAAAGADSAVVLPARFATGGLTRAVYRGAAFVALPDEQTQPSRARNRVTARVEATAELFAGGVRLVYDYTDVLDAAAHRFGIASAQWLDAAREVDELLTGLAAALPPGSAMLVTADHGGLDVPFEGRVDIDAEPDLADGIAVFAGEPRVRYLHTEPGATADVLAAWRARLGDRATVVTRDEAVEAGWFGRVRPEHAARIGDVVVVCHGEFAVMASEREPARVTELVGMHGADTDVETAVPLIAVTR